MTHKINSHDTTDLEEFAEALQVRMQAENDQVDQLQEFIAATKKSIINVQKERDIVKKEVLVSRKQVQVAK